MTQELIPVRQGHIGGASCHVVDGRRLHAFLGVHWQFGNWIQSRIKQYEEGVDFTFKKTLKRRKGTRGASLLIEYTLTLDMAKELAMLERNDKGREARRYFIECERQLKSALLPTAPKTQVQNRLLKSDALVRDHLLAEVTEHRNRLLDDGEASARCMRELGGEVVMLKDSIISLYGENRDLLHFKVSVLSGEDWRKQRELPLGGAS